jgi:tetratricopeptide (TPR) repeat protein
MITLPPFRFISHRFSLCAAAALITLAAGCSVRQDRLATAPATETGPRFYEGFGNYHRAASTESALAQRWFNQGMQLLYGFNHDEAIRSFEQAAAVDPNCAIAWWGVAYATMCHGKENCVPRVATSIVLPAAAGASAR